MRLRVAIPAGVADTAATALGTFIIQVYVVRTFEAGDLGVYSLFLTAGILAGFAPQFLLLYPIEVAVLDRPRPERIGAFGSSVRLLGLFPPAAVLGSVTAALIAGDQASRSLLLALGVTAAFAAMTTPVYSHLRNLLHLSHRSWLAARVAAAQLALVVVLLVLFLAIEVPPEWIPFAVLALSQAGAVAFGVVTLGWELVAGQPVNRTVRTLVHSGRWLMTSGLVPAAAALIAATLVSRLAGVEDLGHAQAAAVAARPVLVLGAGLRAVLGVRSMEAGRSADRRAANRYWRLYAMAIGVGAAAYAVLAGVDWALNPVAALLPRAYAVDGLVLAVLGANVLASMPKPVRAEFIGGGREKRVALFDSVGAAALVAVAGLASMLGAFAIPGGVAVGATVALTAYALSRRRQFVSRSAVDNLEKWSDSDWGK